MMKFCINMVLTDQDYDVFQEFMIRRHPQGRKRLIGMRIMIAVMPLLFVGNVLLSYGFTAQGIINSIPFVVVAVFFEVLLLPYMRWIVKRQRKRVQKAGGAAFTPLSVMKFYEDRFCEIAAGSHIENAYTLIHSVSVVGNESVYIHLNEIQGYIVLANAFTSPAEFADFVAFLKTKCASVTHY